MNSLRHMLSREDSVPGHLDRATDDQIIDQAAQLLGWGIWHVHEAGTTDRIADTQSRSDTCAGAQEKSEPDEQPAKTLKPPDPVKPKLSWIEIRLVDSNGKPVPGAAYEVTMPDGAIRSGTLDSKGVARCDQIPPGLCEVRFPKLDANEWKRG